MLDLKSKIRTFIVENFLFGNTNGLSDDTSFIEDGIIDSTGVLELIAFLEEEISIKIEDEELVPENLDSINRISIFIQEKLKMQN